jgi:hypothetical protein
MTTHREARRRGKRPNLSLIPDVPHVCAGQGDTCSIGVVGRNQHRSAVMRPGPPLNADVLHAQGLPRNAAAGCLFWLSQPDSHDHVYGAGTLYIVVELEVGCGCSRGSGVRKTIPWARNIGVN